MKTSEKLKAKIDKVMSGKVSDVGYYEMMEIVDEVAQLEVAKERLKTTGDEAWIYMFDDLPKKFNAKRRAYEAFYDALRTSSQLEADKALGK